MKALFALAAATIVVCPCYGHSQVSVDHVILNFAQGEPPVANLNVRNSSGSVVYVQTETFEVLNPGTPTEERQPTDLLLISPKRFSVPAESQRTVRLLLRDRPGAVEKTYRASFVPVENEASFEKSVDKNADRRAVLRVFTGMGILVFVKPVHPNPNLTWRRTDQQVRIANSGNMNVFVDQFKVCFENGSCRELSPKRFYPGNFRTVDSMPPVMVSFRMFANAQYSNIVIPINAEPGDHNTWHEQQPLYLNGGSTDPAEGAVVERTAGGATVE